jgi:ankyrin repeat protein
VLRFAITSGHISTVRILLQINFSISKPLQDYENQRGLLLAVKGGHIAIVKLLEAGVDVNAKSATDLSTALQAATEGGHMDIVKLLHEAEAGINAGQVETRRETKTQAEIIEQRFEEFIEKMGVERRVAYEEEVFDPQDQQEEVLTQEEIIRENERKKQSRRIDLVSQLWKGGFRDS